MLLNRFIFYFLILSASSTAFAGTNQSCPSELPFPAPSQETLDCNYYLQREDVQNCGENSYFKGFGYKFCQAFQDYSLFKRLPKNINAGFSKEAILWYTQVGICLQNKLHNNSLERVSQNKELLSCQAVSEFAIDSHPECYLQPNIKDYPDVSVCNLGSGDRGRIAWVIKSSFLNFKIIKQMFKVIAECGFENQNKILSAYLAKPE